MPWETHPGILLRAMRRRRRISQRELAAIAQLPRSSVARIEAGHSMPRLDTFVKLVDASRHCLVLIDSQGRCLEYDTEHDAIVDRAGRHFPAHLDAVPTGDFEPIWWWGWFRIAWSARWETVPAHVQARRPRPARYRGRRWGPMPYAHPDAMREIT